MNVPAFNFGKIAKIATFAVLLPLAGLGLWNTTVGAQEEPVTIPVPAVDVTQSGSQTAVFAGGCFWGVQAVFAHVKGVTSAISGYAGGTVANPSYEQVGTETTGHAEAVQVTFDPSVVSYGKLLQIFFSVATNPTELNYQGSDQGTSYRSALFVTNADQKKVADAYIAQLDKAGAYHNKIVTEVTGYTNFYKAEDYHQDNGTTLKVNAGYVQFWDVPKVEALKSMFPNVWRDKPYLVFSSNA
jgi:peptide-methionine (S)-S-oxide reductase